MLVEQRIDIRENEQALPVGPFDDDLSVPHRPAGAQNLCHRSLGGVERRAVGLEGTVGAAEAELRVSGDRCVAPQLGGAPIILDEDAFAVTGVDPDR